MEAASRLTAQIDQLIALFNRGAMDLPDGLFDRKTQFVLNGKAFEERLGQPPNDPLILMLARGPAGYRFAAKAIQHAIPDARVERVDGATVQGCDGAKVQGCEGANVQCWLSGHLRGTNEPAEVLFDVEFVVSVSGVIERAAVTMDETTLARIREARLRE